MSKTTTTAITCDWPDCTAKFEYVHTVARGRREAAQHGWGRLAGAPLNPNAPTGPPVGLDYCPAHTTSLYEGNTP